MKKEDIARAEEKGLEIITGFQYQKGSICRISLDDDDPVSIPKLKESIDQGAAICPRCEGPMEVRSDGKWFCPRDGLVLTDELRKKLNI